MQYSPAASVIMVEAKSLALLCPHALGHWSGALLELSCSLAVLLPQAASFLQKNPTPQQRHTLGHNDHHRAGNLLVPGLLLTIPASPEKSHTQDQRGENAHRGPHQRNPHSHRTAVRAHHFNSENNSAHARPCPRPHR